jgi:hypothetical protein
MIHPLAPLELIMEPQELDTLACLCRQLIHAKKAEEKDKSKRIEIEEKIAVLVPGPEKGQKTVTLPDGSKVTVERGFNYKAACDMIEAAMRPLDRPAPVKVKTTRELDEKGYEWYRENDEDAFNLISSFVTVTPKKVSVSVKEPK